MTFKVLALLVLLILGTSVLLAFTSEAEERYAITGSSTVAPILQRVSEEFDALPDGGARLVLDVQTGGSTRGIVDARAGAVDAGMASRDLSPEEARELEVVTIAQDGIALIVHADNPLGAVDTETVRRIFRGQVGRWSELDAARGTEGGGGSQAEIAVINKAEGRATLTVFLEHFGLENREIRAAAVIGDNAQGVRLVSGNPDAIGYVSIGEALHARASGAPIKLLELDGVAAMTENVADGSYRLRRPLHLLFPGELDPQDRALLDFLAGPRGRAIIADFHFVPVLEAEPEPDPEAGAQPGQAHGS